MKAYLVEVFSGPIPAEGDSLEEVIENVRDQILDGRIKLMVGAERVYSEEAEDDFEPEETLARWDIGQDVAGLIEEATTAGAN